MNPQRINDLLKLIGVNDTEKRLKATFILEGIIRELAHSQDVTWHSDGPAFASTEDTD